MSRRPRDMSCATWRHASCQLLVLLCATVLPSCEGPGATTRVRVELTYPTDWGVTRLEAEVDGVARQARATQSLEVLLRDELAGHAVGLTIRALRGDVRVASGRTTVTPVRGEEVRVTLTLSRVACGAWCLRGTQECRGDGTVVCEQRDDDACMEWSEPIACPSDASHCSRGTCSAHCEDECLVGETRCDGAANVRTCGQHDGDACVEWGAPTPCPAGRVCSLGTCATRCRDACARGEVRCLGDGTVTCGDLDDDGCLEWSPVTTCGPGMTCSAGRCAPPGSCRDECTANACDAFGFRTCGELDGDPCRDLSFGASCTPTDACSEGTCEPLRGCVAAPRVCMSPPANTCVDEDTLRTYEALGQCMDGECEYVATERECPHCPACDACAGTECTTPPSVCFAARGTCTMGSCSYAFVDRVSCDDGDPCTTADVCGSGLCRGTPMRCVLPPAPTCIDGTTLRTFAAAGTCDAGTCSYASTDVPCTTAPAPAACYGAGVCASGRCNYAFMEGARCDDGDAGTTNDTCSAGACRGTRVPSGWRAMPGTSPLGPRSYASAVWTGTEMIVWGGFDGSRALGDGARYDPSTGSWRMLPTAGAPAARLSHSAVWTGTEMIVWGGLAGDVSATGARFSPATNAWSALGGAGPPEARWGHRAVWTGTHMIVWGGETATRHVSSGGRFNPVTSAWTAMSSVSAPTGRLDHGAVWTGSEMIVWGGYDGDAILGTGGRYNPATDAWSTFASTGAPSARSGHVMVWTGTRLLVWGGSASDGERNDGAVYDPATGWTPMLRASAPSARAGAASVWTGSEMIVWGGGGSTSGERSDGAIYRP